MTAKGKFRAAILTGFACLSFQFLTLECNAEGIYTLSDGNSSASINPSSQAGMFDWSIDGQNQLNQQWFWYRVGDAAEQSVDKISVPSVTQPNPRTLYTVYNAPSFSVEIDYVLKGFPAGGISDIAETISIQNHTDAALDFHFFQYSDFNLLGNPAGESVELGKNRQGLYNEAYQAKGTLGITETVAAPGANHGEAALSPATLLKLNDGIASNLDDDAGPVGPGDATWALQWDVTIPAHGGFLISKDKYLSVVPEPSAVILATFGLLCLGGAVLRRKMRG